MAATIAERSAWHQVRRLAYISAGGVMLVLAIAGAVLPLLPATPFLLLTNYFFVRSSPRLTRMLHEHRTLGPLLQNWQRQRSIPARIKWYALGSMSTAVAISLGCADLSTGQQVALIILAVIGACVILSLRTSAAQAA